MKRKLQAGLNFGQNKIESDFIGQTFEWIGVNFQKEKSFFLKFFNLKFFIFEGFIEKV